MPDTGLAIFLSFWMKLSSSNNSYFQNDQFMVLHIREHDNAFTKYTTKEKDLTDKSGSWNANIRTKQEWTGISCDITANSGDDDTSEWRCIRVLSMNFY